MKTYYMRGITGNYLILKTELSEEWIEINEQTLAFCISNGIEKYEHSIEVEEPIF